MATFFRQFSDEENKKKSKQIGQEKVALTITGAGVVARKLTFSNNISELLDGAPPAPRWLFDYITVTSHVAGLSRTQSRTPIVSRSHRWHSQTKSQAHDEPNIQQLKCSLTAPRRAGTSFGFFFLFVSFHSASSLSLGDLVQRCLGQPVDVLAPWPSAVVIPRRRSTAVHFQSVERRVQRNLEGLANVRFDPDELPGCRAATLTFFFLMLTRRRGLGERGDKILRWRHHNCTHHDACRRETAWVFPETFRSASRKTEQPFQAQSVSHRTG